MSRRGYYRSSGRNGGRSTVTPIVAISSETTMRPGEVCSAGLLAFGASFVFGRLVAIVVWGGSMPALLLGLMIGLTFAAAGAAALCIGSESRSRRTERVSAEDVVALLAVVVFVGSVLGALL